MRLLLPLSLLLATSPLGAQQMVTSAGPKTVGVTLYRAPDRDADEAMDLEYLEGFALITETREVDLPPGEVTVRFEGVASGIQPVSAILLGSDIKEKNRDRQLLSQRGLLDRFTGQRVTIKRTNPGNGAVTEEPGTIRTGADGLILQTAAGYESLYCTWLDQTVLFPGVPRDLTAKPTLSVTTRDQPGGKQTLTLSYLASKFDWQANYVGELSADGKSMNLLGWLTMASGDETSFVDANAYAVAGKLERSEDDGNIEEEDEAEDEDIEYECWPWGTTTSGLTEPPPPFVPYPAPPPPPAPMMMRMDEVADMESASIVVTGSRIARQEDIGDLKLYQIPFPVTVAAQSQKQVAFLNKKSVKGEMIYRTRYPDEGNNDVEMVYRVQNKKEDGLGDALPAGKIAFFQQAAGRRMLVGESDMGDKAIGEEVEYEFAGASNVTVDVKDDEYGKNWDSFILKVNNANPFPVTYEAEFENEYDKRFAKFNAKTFRKDGKFIWRVTVPANGEAILKYREEEIKTKD